MKPRTMPAPAQLLDRARVAQQLAAVPQWAHDPDQGTLRRDFLFADFAAAFAFMTRVALAAERADHHPAWSNVGNRVSIALSTHSAGGVTQRDFELALAIDDAFAAA
jgi:4a-hydroxytetrahydrobiopterin dehydratase